MHTHIVISNNITHLLIKIIIFPVYRRFYVAVKIEKYVLDAITLFLVYIRIAFIVILSLINPHLPYLLLISNFGIGIEVSVWLK